MLSIKLKDIILSVAQSVEDAHTAMSHNKVAVVLDEFELTLTLQGDVDIASLKSQDKKNETDKKVAGLKFLDIKRNVPKSSSLTNLTSHPELGTMTIRVIFAPKESTE